MQKCGEYGGLAGFVVGRLTPRTSGLCPGYCGELAARCVVIPLGTGRHVAGRARHRVQLFTPSIQYLLTGGTIWRYIYTMRKNGHQRKRTTPAALMTHARQLAALELRASGLSYDEIVATGLYASKSGAYAAVCSALDRNASEPTERVRQMEISRLDALLKAVWPMATAAVTPQGVDAVLKIMQRRSKLLGLDAPLKIDLSALIADAAELSGLDPEKLLTEAQGVTAELGATSGP